MSQIDATKEQIGVYKFWLGVVIGTLFALVGWAGSNYKTAKTHVLCCAGTSSVVMFGAVVVINRKIRIKIDEIKSLKDKK